MKPEPLKDKIHWISQLINDNYIQARNKDIFFRSDVKSAVAWLKREIYLSEPAMLNSLAIEHICAKIDKAFQDVSEHGRTKKHIDNGQHLRPRH